MRIRERESLRHAMRINGLYSSTGLRFRPLLAFIPRTSGNQVHREAARQPGVLPCLLSGSLVAGSQDKELSVAGLRYRDILRCEIVSSDASSVHGLSVDVVLGVFVVPHRLCL